MTKSVIATRMKLQIAAASVAALSLTAPAATQLVDPTDASAPLTKEQVTSSPAAERLLEIIQALNGDDKGIAAFADRNPWPAPPPGAEGPPPPPILQILLETRQESHGYSLVRFTEAGEQRAKALVRNRLTGLVQELIVFVEARPPHGIEGWGVRSPTMQEPSTGMTDAERVAEITTFLKRLNEAGAFSGVVLIAKEGKPIFQEAYGFADIQKRVPNTLQTRFRLASLNKMFTGFAIGRLVEQGKLSYEDPLSKFIPDFPDPESARKVRIKHLLSHTSGLTSFFPPAVHNAQKRGSTALGMAALPKMSLESEPGTKWQYSNTGMLLLGRIIEIVTGENYFDHLERTMLAPLGLKHTGFPDYDAAIDIALPYEATLDPAGKLALKVPGELTRWGGPAGDAAANARDLIRFAELLEAGKVVLPATLKLHTSPKVELKSPSYGYAVDFDFDGRDIYGHSGGAPGTCSQLAVIRDLPSRYSFVVLGNACTSSCRAAVIKIANTFAPRDRKTSLL